MDYICEFTLEKSSEQLKDTKGVIRSRNSKVRQYNSQNNKDKKASSTQKTKDRTTRTSLPVPQMTPVV
jgi:hypothetical protein